MTLNMVRPSQINPELLAYTLLWRIFNFEKLHLLHMDSMSLYMNAHNKQEHGMITALWDFIQDQKCTISENTTDASQPQQEIELVTHLNYLPRMQTCHKHQKKERLTQVTEDLLTKLKHSDPRTIFLDQSDKTIDAINKI